MRTSAAWSSNLSCVWALTWPIRLRVRPIEAPNEIPRPIFLWRWRGGGTVAGRAPGPRNPPKSCAQEGAPKQMRFFLRSFFAGHEPGTNPDHTARLATRHERPHPHTNKRHTQNSAASRISILSIHHLCSRIATDQPRAQQVCSQQHQQPPLSHKTPWTRSVPRLLTSNMPHATHTRHLVPSPPCMHAPATAISPRCSKLSRE